MPAYLQRRLSGWAETPLSVIASAPEWLKWRIFGVEKWQGGEGRVQLIGDAWHAMRPYLASGGVMAIEDGAAIAVSLTKSRGDIVEGLKLFRKSRGPRVWHVAQASAQMGRVYNCPQPFDMVRDLAIRLSSGFEAARAERLALRRGPRYGWAEKLKPAALDKL